MITFTSNSPSPSLRHHYAALKQLTVDRDALVAKAAASLSTLHSFRGRRADAAGLRDRLDDIQTHARRLRLENENSNLSSLLYPRTYLRLPTAHERIISTRNALAIRRQTLEDAYRTVVSPSPPLTPTLNPLGHPRPAQSSSAFSPLNGSESIISECMRSQAALQDALAVARQGLVQELVDVFAIVEVGGRPAAGVRAATRGEWAIGGLVLPVPGDMRRMCFQTCAKQSYQPISRLFSGSYQCRADVHYTLPRSSYLLSWRSSALSDIMERWETWYWHSRNLRWQGIGFWRLGEVRTLNHH